MTDVADREAKGRKDRSTVWSGRWSWRTAGPRTKGWWSRWSRRLARRLRTRQEDA